MKLIREEYEGSSAAHAQSVIDAVTMYEAELENINVNTDKFLRIRTLTLPQICQTVHSECEMV